MMEVYIGLSSFAVIFVLAFVIYWSDIEDFFKF
jgi:hypothetical protein